MTPPKRITRRAALALCVAGAAGAAHCLAPLPSRAAGDPPPTTGSAYAVIVAMTYENSPANRLVYPRKDAERFRAALKAAPDNVSFLSDGDTGAAHATKSNILAAVRRVAALTKPGDTFWFYYSGHGRFLPRTESSYLIPADVRSLTEESGIAVRELRELLADPAVCRAGTKIVVLDACESGSSKAWQEAAAPTLTPVGGVLTLAAARPDRSAFETESAPVTGGLFTYYLCAGLDGAATAAPEVTMGDLRDYVAKQVNEACVRINQPPQEPVFLAGAGTGDWAKLVVARRDDAALAALQVTGAGGLTANQFSARPNLDAGTILAVDGDEAIREKTALSLKSSLLALGKRVYTAEIAPAFWAVLNDPGHTAEAAKAAERLSARRLLRVRATATSSPSTLVSGVVINRVFLRAELLDVRGEVLAVAEATSPPRPSGEGDSVRLPVLEEQVEAGIQKLLQSPTLVNALPGTAN